MLATTPINTLKDVLKNKIQYIQDHSGIFRPYNKIRNDLLAKQIDNADLRKLTTINGMLSNNNAGLAPINPLVTPLKTVSLQFEQGYLGWQWYYATFTLPEPVCFFISFARKDLGNQEIRSKKGLPLGSTDIYLGAIGVGFRGKWYTPGPFVFPGNYSTDNPSQMSIQSINTVIGQNLKIDWDGTTVQLNASWDNNTLSATMVGNGLPSFNMPNGCAPCMDTGTNYWSYTSMNCSAKLNVSGVNFNLSNGEGWIDRQWGKGNYARNYFT